MAEVGVQLQTRLSRGTGRQARLHICDTVEVRRLQLVRAILEEADRADRSTLTLALGHFDGSLFDEGEVLPASLSFLVYWPDFAESCAMAHALQNPPQQISCFWHPKRGERHEAGFSVQGRLRSPGEYPPILDTGRGGFPGFRLMREFFALPQRFLVFEFTGLDGGEAPAKISEFSIEIPINQSVGQVPMVTENNFLLNTAAAVNSWHGSSKSIHSKGNLDRYALEPDHGQGAVIVNIENIRILRKGADTYESLPRFDYFNRWDSCYKTDVETTHFTEGKSETRWFLNLKNIGKPGDQVTVVAEIQLCDEGAANLLGPNQSLDNFEGLPDDVTCKTFAPCSEFVLALDSESQYWQLVDMLACNLTTFGDPARFRNMLAHLNRTNHRIARKAIRGIQDVELTMSSTTFWQQPAKIVIFKIFVDPGHFLNRGHLELFFSVFNEFMKEFIPLNCLLETLIVHSESKEILCHWKPQIPAPSRT